MNTAVYPEPYKLPAGILAVLVHGAFFALMYFGFSWQTQPPEVMSVELWQSLPDMPDAPPARKIPAKANPAREMTEKVVPLEVEAERKPDIVMPDKKPAIKPEKKIEVKPGLTKPPEVKKLSVQPAKPSAAELQAARQKAAQAAADKQAARDQAAQEAATGRVVDEYISKISAKIRRNVVMPPEVADNARAEFLVTLLPGGRVMGVKLKKSSGNPAYDASVERAILKSDPLPLPADAGLFNRFRELKLGFQPVEPVK